MYTAMQLKVNTSGLHAYCTGVGTSCSIKDIFFSFYKLLQQQLIVGGSRAKRGAGFGGSFHYFIVILSVLIFNWTFYFLLIVDLFGKRKGGMGFLINPIFWILITWHFLFVFIYKDKSVEIKNCLNCILLLRWFCMFDKRRIK